ncbi:MAG: hypothetical protein MZV70_30110 [Desulfobacterales bacterium]|nr:hypothetical protein [Desulfobacterales bacterium]
MDFLPGITYPLIRVHIWWRGATPEEIDNEPGRPHRAADGHGGRPRLPGILVHRGHVHPAGQLQATA